MAARLLHFLWLYLKSFALRFVHDASREITTLIAAGALMGTVFYVAHDFITAQMRLISEGVAAGLSLIGTIMLFAVVVRALIELLTKPDAFERTLRYLATDRSEITYFLWLRWIVVTFAALALLTWVVQTVLETPARALLLANLASLAVMIFETWRTRARYASGTTSQNENPARERPNMRWARLWLAAPLLELGQSPRTKEVLKWRIILLSAHPISLFTSAALACCCVLFSAVAFVAQQPLVLPALGCMVGGLIASIPIVLGLATDLPQAWTEKMTGLTHAEYVAAYDRVAIGTAAFLLGMFLTVSVAYSYVAQPASATLPLATLTTQFVQLMAILLAPLLTVASVIFQIDARRPFTTLTVELVLCCLIGTAILASPLGIALVPLVRYYGRTLQVNRFYRA